MKKLLKLIFTLMLSLAFVFPTISDSEARIVETLTANISEDIIITVNGERVPFKAAIVNGRAYLPVRVIGYALNSNVEWVESTREILLETQKERVPYKEFSDLVSINSGRITAHRINNMYLHLNGNYNDNASKQIILIEERSYLPVRAISENLGIRSTWIEEDRTIEIINPRTQDVSDEYKDLYIEDLPIIETPEDYIVGNWSGNNSSIIDRTGIAYNNDSKLFISKQENGKYRVHRRDIFNDKDNPKYNGLKTETLYENVTIDEGLIMLLGPHNGRIIVNETPVSLVPARKPYQLTRERLFGDFTDIGYLESEYKRF